MKLVRRVLPTFLALVALTAVFLTGVPAAHADFQTTPSPSWGVDGRVHAIVEAGGRAFLGGAFTEAMSGSDSAGRPHLAALDAVTGELITGWAPETNGTVRTLALSADGSTLYLGGDFTTVNGQSRARLAAVSTSSGELLGWNPGADNAVHALAVVGSTVYAGGNFSSLAGESATRVGAVDASTGARIAAFDVGANRRVRVIVPVPGSDRVLLGGLFTRVNDTDRGYAAIVDGSSGALDPWTAEIPCANDDTCSVGDALIAGGSVVVASTGDGGWMATYDLATGSLTYRIHADGDVQAVAHHDGIVFAGGHFFAKFGRDGNGDPIVRRRLAAVELATGQVTDFAPVIEGDLGVWEITASPDWLRLGGDFTTVAGEERTRYAQLEGDGTGGDTTGGDTTGGDTTGGDTTGGDTTGGDTTGGDTTGGDTTGGDTTGGDTTGGDTTGGDTTGGDTTGGDTGGSTPDPVRRFGGETRIETAVLISQAHNDPGVDTAYVATAADYPDGLAVGPIAALRESSLLLTWPDSLPDPTASELERLAPQQIVVLGGPAAVNDEVLAQLDALAPQGASRLAGADRYETAAKVSASWFGPGTNTVFVATGSTFPDALSGGSLAATLGAPLLLVGIDTVPETTAGELERLAPARIVVLGGPAVVSDAVYEQLGGFARDGIERVFGADRYATSAAVLAGFGDAPSTVYVATGRNFADSLSGTAVAGVRGAPLVLVAPDHVPDVMGEQLDRLDPSRYVILGGPSAIQPEVEDELRARAG